MSPLLSPSPIEVRPPARREREKNARRNEILAAAERVFAERGFHPTSIDQIAQAGEFAKGTLYLYFPSKEALYSALFEQKIGRMIALARHRVHERAGGNASDMLTALVSAQLDFFEHNRRFFRIFAEERMELTDNLKRDDWAGVHRLYQEYLGFISTLIVAGQKQHDVRPGPARLYALALLGVINALTRDWLSQGARAPLSDQTAFITELCLHGATPTKA